MEKRIQCKKRLYKFIENNISTKVNNFESIILSLIANYPFVSSIVVGGSKYSHWEKNLTSNDLLNKNFEKKFWKNINDWQAPYI